jgi:hypothetical protein
MATFKTRADLAAKGTLTVVGLPFKSGEKVEVTVEPIEEAQEEKDRYPLRGKRYKYDRPFDGVAFDDWGIVTTKRM